MADDAANTTEAMDVVESAVPAVESTDSSEQKTVADDAPTVATAEKDTAVEMQSKEDNAGSQQPAEDASESDTGSPKITILVKTPQDKKNVSVDPLSSVKELKEATAKAFKTSVEQLCFIFTGKMLQDEDQLAVHGIEDGGTVHLVIKSASVQTEVKTSQSQFTDQTSSASDGAHGTMSYSPLDFATVGLDKLNYTQLQQHMQRQLSSNPELIRQMVQNPLVQQLMANPSIVTDLMSSNAQSKEWLQRNPELADMLKNQEVMDQTLEISRNPEMLNELISAQSKGHLQFSASVTSSPGGQLKFGAAATLPELQMMWQQLAQKPQVLQQMYNMPYMKSMLEGFAANPQLAQQMIGSHPMFAGNAALQQQWQQMMPQYIQQLQNPATQSLITNPKALQAMLKIQQGMDMLHGEAPGLVSSVGLPNLSVPTTLPMFMPTPPTVATGGIPVGHPDVVSNVMSQMIQQMASGRINQPPEERFRDQLDQLSAMGFADHQTNLSVLVRTFGDVASAVELLQQP